ncbi:MAG: AMP-binding protein, partial [Nocardia sp.]|nr:AMP-binding protein [Nocardia sp.]
MTSTAAGTHRDGYVPFPADLADSYRAAGYWTGTTLGDLLRDSARRGPARPALLGDRPLTYAELDTEADRMAYGFLRLGIAPGDRVIVQLLNTPDFAVVLFGLLRAGIIPVLTLPGHRRAEIEHLARLSGAVAYLVADRHGDFDYRQLAAALRETVESLRHILVSGDAGEFTELMSIADDNGSLPAIDPGDIALMLVSGGTTGLPKLIARTHDDYVYNATASAAVCGLGEQDVYLATLPAAHTFPLACPGILGTVATGGAL